MNVIEEGQVEGSSEGFEDNESIFEFYGGMIFKQNENKSLYHYGNTSNADEVQHWGQVRLIRDKYIYLYKKYTNKC